MPKELLFEAMPKKWGDHDETKLDQIFDIDKTNQWKQGKNDLFDTLFSQLSHVVKSQIPWDQNDTRKLRNEDERTILY